MKKHVRLRQRNRKKSLVIESSTRFAVTDIWYKFELMLPYSRLILCDKVWSRFSKKGDRMLLWYFEDFLHINIILWYLSFFFGQWKALRRQAYLNLIETCFETIRLILGSIFNVLHKNSRMKEYLTYTCENLIWKLTYKLKGGIVPSCELLSTVIWCKY